MTHIATVKNTDAIRGWLHSTLRDACRMRLRREVPDIETLRTLCSP
jgi:hypothetical protein